MNKKGQILDLISFGVVALVFLVIIAAILTGMDKFNDRIQVIEEDEDLKKFIDDDTKNNRTWWDFGFVFFFFLFLMIILILNFFLGTNIAFIIIYIVSVLFMGTIFVALHNGLAAVKDNFATLFADLPLTSFTIDAFYPIMILFYLFFFILLFAKPRGQHA